MLAVHSVAGYDERGLGLTLSLGNPGGEGLSLSMSPRWGDAAHRIPGGRLLNWSATLNHAPTGPRFTLGAQLSLGTPLGLGSGTSTPDPSTPQ